MTVAPIGAPAAPTIGAPAAAPSFAKALQARMPPPPSSTPATAGSPVGALASIERAQARLDAVLAAARAGRTFTAAELIGLQAEAYRCAQTVDLAAKLAEQGAHSIKQALNTQL